MSFDYTNLKSTAERLISKFGQTASLKKPGARTGPDYDPTFGADVVSSVVVVELAQKDMPSSESQNQDRMRRLYVSTSAGVTPATGDRIAMDGVDYKIARVEPLNPGGTVLLWEVYLED